MVNEGVGSTGVGALRFCAMIETVRLEFIVALSVLGALLGRLVQSSVLIGVSCLFPVVMMMISIARRRQAEPRVGPTLPSGVRVGGAAEEQR